MPKDQRPPERDNKRESIWSVAKGWLPGYLFLVFLLTLIWTAFVVWVENTYGSYAARWLLLKASVTESSAGILGIALGSLAAVTIADTGGGAIVVTYRYLNNKFVEPLRRQLRQEGQAAGREEGLEEGLEQGIEEGLEQGREEGIQQGREQGIAEGIQQGREQGRAEGIQQGREEGIQQGIQAGREQGILESREQVHALQLRTMEWYTRQQVALAKGEPFDEPPPFSELSNGKKPAGE